MSFSYNNRTYYVNSSAQPTNNSSQAAKWFMDENGYLRTGTNGGTYLATGSYQIVTTTTNPGEAVACEFSNGYIVIKGTTNQYLRRYSNNYLRFQNNNGQRVTTTSTNTQATVGALSGGAQTCTLKVYGTDETTPVQTEEVKRSNNHGIIPLTGLNNDAIKFSVQGTGYVKLNVTLQALNPYIDQMTVVLNDTYNGKNIRQTRTFTADDFSVGGDTFKFYLPKECVHDPLTITFEDLYSKYGDETYNHTKKPGTSDSRYNYVKSQHYNAFNKNNDASTLDNNIYYNKVEAASSTLESARLAAANGGQYVRTKVGTVGNIAFRFNNADELATNTGYLTEYPFTLAKYRNQTKPGAGNFIEATFNQNVINETNWSQKTFYVFTTDETRYNIAPTTATQHRFYAFYKMIVEVLCDDYEPSVQFEKIYDTTFNENGTSAFFGVKVSAPTSIEAPLASDVATYRAICKAIEKRGDDVNVPKTLAQILYVDLSGLNGVYHSNGTGVDEDDEEDEGKDYSMASFNELKSKLAPNALVFLPINSTERYDNFAYAKKGEVAGSFQSANNIILTDKTPFYTPYTIQVDAANYATYKRLRTAASEGLVKKATIIMPFDLEVDANGVHKNPTETGSETGSGFQFCLRELKQLQTQDGIDQYSEYNASEGKGNFMPVKPNSYGKVPANTPYMVEVLSDNGTDYSFIATQKGSNIIATPTSITGESVKIGNSNTTLTNTGTYSGITIPKANNVYYFTRGMYVSSLSIRYDEVYVFPFRAYYVTSTTSSSPNTAKIGSFEILYDEPLENYGITTEITSVRPSGPLTITTGKAFMLIKAAENVRVNISSINGVNVGEFYMNANEQKQISLPAGVYIVNNTKIIVK